jgi:hypothetical protein
MIMNYKMIISILVFSFLTASFAIADDRLTKFYCGKTSITLYNTQIPESPFFITVWNGKSKEY